MPCRRLSENADFGSFGYAKCAKLRCPKGLILSSQTGS